MRMCEHLDVVARTNEQAKIFGIDFQSVLFRGSQYRVESMMLRLAHRDNFLAPSPSNEQAEAQPVMECIPLVMVRLSQSPRSASAIARTRLTRYFFLIGPGTRNQDVHEPGRGVGLRVALPKCGVRVQPLLQHVSWEGSG